MSKKYAFPTLLTWIATWIILGLPALTLHAQDYDSDGITDASDNCPNTPNANQRDADSDGIGDACLIITGVNGDSDVWPDNIDNCASYDNNDQADADADGEGDACDTDVVCSHINCLNGGTKVYYGPRNGCLCSCAPGWTGASCQSSTGSSPNPGGGGSAGVEIAVSPSSTQTAYLSYLAGSSSPSIESYATDYDQDGVLNGSDNSPYIANASQTDTDSDGIGDASDNCYNTANADQADADNNGVGDACDATFPVELISFEAIRGENVVEIHWSTESELNNHYFRLEKGYTPSSLSLINEVRGAGTTQEFTAYRVEDQGATQNNTYYRLSQVDYNGRSRIIGMVELTSEEASSVPLVTISPNPASASDQIQIRISSTTERQSPHFAVMMYDLKGQLLQERVYAGNASGNQLLLLDLPESIAAGAYIISVISDRWEQRQTLIIQ